MSWNFFRPKSRILFYSSLASIWCKNFQDGTFPVGGDTWPSIRRKERKRNRIIRRERQHTLAYVEPYEKKTRKQSSRPVTRPSADFQTRFFRRLKRLRKILRSVAQLSRDSSWRSGDRQPTVEQRFFDVSSNSVRFGKKSLNGHATVVGGHATVGRLSNNVFCTFQAIWKNFEKSHWTVTRQWSEVTRPSADYQTTSFGRFKQFEIFSKKVTERSRDSGRRSRDRRLTVKHIYSWIRETEREREGGRERLSPLHSIRAPPCCAVGRFISRRPGWG